MSLRQELFCGPGQLKTKAGGTGGLERQGCEKGEGILVQSGEKEGRAERAHRRKEAFPSAWGKPRLLPAAV